MARVKKTKKKFTQFDNPQLANASKTLLANIRFTGLDNDVKTIVVTSSVANEGKTTVSTNLASAIASSGKKVLLVEADMRRSCLRQLVNQRPAYGIYSLLSEQASLREAIVKTAIPNLYFLDAEPNIPSPPDILSTKRFSSLVYKLEELFDYVIFDTPPISLFIDAAIISNLVDGTLLVVRQQFTKKAAVEKSIQQLSAADARVLGTVMTFCDAEEDDYYYAYYSPEGKRVSKSKRDKIAIPNQSAVDDLAAWDERPKRKRSQEGKPERGLPPEQTGPTGAYQAGSFKEAPRAAQRPARVRETPARTMPAAEEPPVLVQRTREREDIPAQRTRERDDNRFSGGAHRRNEDDEERHPAPRVMREERAMEREAPVREAQPRHSSTPMRTQVEQAPREVRAETAVPRQEAKKAVEPAVKKESISLPEERKTSVSSEAKPAASVKKETATHAASPKKAEEPAKAEENKAPSAKPASVKTVDAKKPPASKAAASKPSSSSKKAAAKEENVEKKQEAVPKSATANRAATKSATTKNAATKSTAAKTATTKSTAEKGSTTKSAAAKTTAPKTTAPKTATPKNTGAKKESSQAAKAKAGGTANKTATSSRAVKQEAPRQEKVEAPAPRKSVVEKAPQGAPQAAAPTVSVSRTQLTASDENAFKPLIPPRGGNARKRRKGTR